MHPRTHFDAGAAGFAVALREVHVAGGEERTGHVDRQQDGRAGGQLLDVEVAAGFTRWGWGTSGNFA